MAEVVLNNPNGEAAASRPAPLACSNCRLKHLRCDAVQPICSRCDADALECNYTPSRRGLVGRNSKKPDRSSRNRTPQHRMAATAMGPAIAHQPQYQPHQNQQRHPPQQQQQQQWPASPATPPSERQQATPALTAPYTDSSLLNHRPLSPACAPTTDGNERFVRLYYAMFHSGHPFLVPRSHYAALPYPQSLTAVIHFVGGHYVSPPPGENARNETAAALTSDKTQSVHMVQAALLFSIALHARNEPQNAMTFLRQAVDMAIGLGLNDPSAADRMQDPVIAESLRRTWWELYIIEGYLAALHQQTSFRCNTVDRLPPLPGEDADYAHARFSQAAQSLDDFERRLFSDELSTFSSFSFRIAATRILGKVIAVASSDDARAEEVQAMDNAIMSWKHNLPASKESIFNQYGEVDSMLAQSHVLINCASIMLHFPRSELPLTLPNTARAVDCAKNIALVPPTSAQHAIKAIAASKELVSLAAMPWPVERHSPLLICGLVLACVVQLSECSSRASARAHSCLQEHRDRVTLIMGVLKKFSRHWEIARRTLAQLRVVAKGVFDPQPPAEFSVTFGSSSYDNPLVEAADSSWLNLFFTDALQTQGLLETDVAGF
ncbi:hypothetical protein LTR36_001808 [Oleoguttula mirabilis]|uniref:Zn(2)-C6 fungal-type domain-containing protein n=1 Tax=Oleoguttula mirabilis TaxID=1507867 RepID=A0AAV9JMM7_9PEZI|nr:hypothetical protein LTR36_001808 [Oleoguttula mirabilis]